MARKSVVDRYELFIAAAVVAAHSVGHEGFRQIDVCWFVELFTNWLEFVEDPSLNIQNTQIARYIDKLVEDGYAKRIAHGKFPLYRLTKAGLIDVGKRVRKPTHFIRREYFFFVYLMARAYHTKISHVLQREGDRFSPALRTELEELFNTDLLLDDQIAAATRELKKLDRRLAIIQNTQDLVKRLYLEGKASHEILAEVDRLHPFGLDQHRRYKEVFSVATDKQALWELTIGNASRQRLMWIPARNMLAHYIEELKMLKTQPDEIPDAKIFAEMLGKIQERAMPQT